MQRLIILIGLLSMIACSTTKKVVENVPVISFDEGMLDLGTMKVGDSKSMLYEFTNTGGKPLIIDLVTACKCTSLEWTRGSIPPNGRGKIEVVFDSTGIKPGDIVKTIDIIANTDPIVVEAKFKVNIKAP